MMNYEEMSDFEINRAVACRLDGTELDSFGKPMFAIDCYFSLPNSSSVEWHRVGADESRVFNPCNNPADAWPIIVGNKICLAFDVMAEPPSQGSWVAQPSYGYSSERVRNDNPLRAAMIVFLMMQDPQ